MKEPNNTSWEALEKAWQKQIQETSDEVPSKLWEELEARLDEKPARPMWTRVSLSPWTWSAAAILALIIGINWESSIPTNSQQKLAQTKVQAPAKVQIDEITEEERQERVSRIQSKTAILSHAQEQITPDIEQEVVVSQEPSVMVANAEEKPEQVEEIWVRIDIDPIEERKAMQVDETFEKPVKRKRNLLGQIFRQVISGEPGGWREIANSNDKISDGIHLVANTVIRTEQSVKQTLQFQ